MRLLVPILFVLLLPSAGRAVRVQVQLTYERGSGAERCPDEQSIRDAVVVRLGYPPFVAQGKLAIAARVKGEGAGLAAKIDLREVSGELLGERELSSPNADCAELAEAMVLAISLAIDPVAVDRKPRATSAEPRAEPRHELRDEPPAGTAAAPSFFATVGAIGSLGQEPSLSLGAAVGAGARWTWLSLGLEARASLPSATLAAEGKVSGSVIAGSAVPCLHRGPFAGCAMVSGGVFRAASEGLAGGRTVNGSFFSAGGRALYELDLAGPLSLRLNADLIVPLVRSSLVVDQKAVWVSSPVAGSVGLALGLKL